MLNNHIETAMQTLNRLAWLLFVALVGATASNAHAQIKVTLTVRARPKLTTCAR